MYPGWGEVDLGKMVSRRSRRGVRGEDTLKGHSERVRALVP